MSVIAKTLEIVELKNLKSYISCCLISHWLLLTMMALMHLQCLLVVMKQKLPMQVFLGFLYMVKQMVQSPASNALANAAGEGHAVEDADFSASMAFSIS